MSENQDGFPYQSRFPWTGSKIAKQQKKTSENLHLLHLAFACQRIEIRLQIAMRCFALCVLLNVLFQKQIRTRVMDSNPTAKVSLRLYHQIAVGIKHHSVKAWSAVH